MSATPAAITSSAMTGSPALTAKASRSFGGLGAGRLEPGQLDRLRSDIARPARPRAPPAARSPARSMRGSTIGVIIALAAQQFGEQLGVGARAAVDLGGVGRLRCASLCSADCLSERREQLLAVGRSPPGPRRRPRSAARRACVAGSLALRPAAAASRSASVRIGSSACVEVGPVDAEVGQRIERRRRIELAPGSGGGAGCASAGSGAAPAARPRTTAAQPSAPYPRPFIGASLASALNRASMNGAPRVYSR